ncbi:hypothetical protein DL769_010093 [Monosporascus sp. CRB-8-3]|nr:hypothetical protein DL769_010093 [Monosporascus sp. CRB-8-3]
MYSGWQHMPDLANAQLLTGVPVTAAPQSLDMNVSPHSPWADTPPQNPVDFGQVPMPTNMENPIYPNHVQSPATPASLLPESEPATPSAIPSGSCNCFTVCLQSVQALHNASSPASPPFATVISLNRKAVEGCAAMLACPNCMSQSGSHAVAMLMTTLIGQIISLYKNVVTHADPQNSDQGISATNPMFNPGVSPGAYQHNGEVGKWVELELLSRELHKLDDLLSSFQEVGVQLFDDAEVTRVMMGFLGQNVGVTRDAIMNRTGGMPLQ